MRHIASSVLREPLRFARRFLRSLPYDGWGFGRERSPEALRIRRHLTSRRWQRFPVFARPFLAIALRGLWLGYSLELARRAVRGSAPALRFRLWRRAVQRAWLYGSPPRITIADASRPAPYNRVGELDDSHWRRLWPVLGDRAVATQVQDKVATAERIAPFGAKTPRVFCEIARGGSVDPAKLPWPADGMLFVKPRHGSRARGAMSLSRLVGEMYLVNGARTENSAGLAARLSRLAAQDSLLVQKFCRPSPETRELSTETCVQIRINSARYPGKDSFVADAYVVIQPPKDHAATTLTTALAVPVEPATGIMEQGYFRKEPLRLYDTVPWNGAPVFRRQAPAYQAAVEMVLSASRAFPRTPVLGWDVLLTDEDPVILEANMGLGWDLLHTWHNRVGAPSSVLPAVMAWLST
jgi:hypothetical protein